MKDEPMIIAEELMKDIHNNAVEKGFYDNGLKPMAEAEMLIVSEIAEALECYRLGIMKTEIADNGKPVGFPSEVADIAIRVIDTMQAALNDRLTDEKDLTSIPTILWGMCRLMFEADPKAVIDGCFYLSTLMGFDLLEEIKRKHEYNKTRSYRHGGKKA